MWLKSDSNNAIQVPQLMKYDPDLNIDLTKDTLMEMVVQLESPWLKGWLNDSIGGPTSHHDWKGDSVTQMVANQSHHDSKGDLMTQMVVQLPWLILWPNLPTNDLAYVPECNGMWPMTQCVTQQWLKWPSTCPNISEWVSQW